MRVCDGCYIKVKLAKVADKEALSHLLGTPASISSSLAPAYAPPIENKTLPETTFNTNEANTTTDTQFEDDLKKAIEISLKESQQQTASKYYIDNTETRKDLMDTEDEANLAAAIEASLKDMKPSLTLNEPPMYRSELSSIDMENIKLFSNLMQRVQPVGYEASNDTQISRLYTQVGALQPKLFKSLDEANKKHGTFDHALTLTIF